MMQSQHSQWLTLATKSLESRLPIDRFDALVALLLKKNARVPGIDILKRVLEIQSSCEHGVDPLLPQYIEHFLSIKWIDEADLLHTLLESFKYRVKDSDHQFSSDKNETHRKLSLSAQLEDVLLSIVVTNLSSGLKPATIKEAKKILKVAITWINVAGRLDSAALLDIQSLPLEVLNTCASLGALTLTLLVNDMIRGVLHSSSEETSSLSNALTTFLPLINQISAPLAQRLEFDVQALAMPDLSAGMSGKIGIGDLQLNGIVNAPGVSPRAGLLIFLEALLCDWPQLDDNSLLTYVHYRNKGDSDASITELVVAAFDLNVIALARGDCPNELSIFRMFVTEKLPLLIVSLSTMAFVPVDVPLIVAPHIQRLPEMLRQEFVLSCVLHGLVLEDNIEHLLGFKPTNGPPREGKMTKETLVNEYRRDASHVEHFVDHLGVHDGNSGIYAEVVIDILLHLSLTRDTMPLRGLCNALASRPEALDALALHTSPTRVLSPLCQLLDGWRHEDDHSEYQPVYDEFGACFLLVMACVARFRMKRADLGHTAAGGFLARVIDGNVSLAFTPKQLSEDDDKHLTKWIQGLFETEGISDELMSACPPQDFYKLVPIIFTQSVIATRTNVLAMDKLKDGLELLLAPFLLPSIVLGIRALIEHLWEYQADANIVLQILHKLLTTSGTASTTHSAVVAIVARDLEHSLLDLKQQPTLVEDSEKLLEVLRPSLQKWHTSRQASVISNSGSLIAPESLRNLSLASFRQDFQSLCAWSNAEGGMETMTYSHRRTSNILEKVGAAKVLRVLVDEVQNCIQDPVLGATALDIATSIIAAPHRVSGTANSDAQLGTSRLDLRMMLQLELQEAAKLSVTHPIRADLLAKLANRVEAQLASIPAADLSTQMPNLLDGTMDIEHQTMEPVAVQVEAATLQEPDTSLSFVADDNDFHLDIDAALASQNSVGHGFGDVPQSADDDIFAGLAFDTEMDFS